MLVVENITASYGSQPVLHSVSTEFANGQLTALVGPNGCGKSTLLKAIMGFVPTSQGAVRLQGKSVRDLSRRDMALRIAYLPQENICPEYMTLGELIEIAGYARYSLFGGPSAADRQLFADALDTVGLTGLAHRQVNRLSGGQRQRAWIAMVLAQNAEVILLDEPVNHLDVKYQYAVLSLVRTLTRRFGKTVVIVLHDLNLTTAFADNVAMMKDGQIIAAGPVAQTVTTSTVADVFDLSAEVFYHSGRLVCLPTNAHISGASAQP